MTVFVEDAIRELIEDHVDNKFDLPDFDDFVRSDDLPDFDDFVTRDENDIEDSVITGIESQLQQVHKYDACCNLGQLFHDKVRLVMYEAILNDDDVRTALTNFVVQPVEPAAETADKETPPKVLTLLKLSQQSDWKHGTQFVGPFESISAATAWAAKHHRHGSFEEIEVPVD